MEPEAASDNGFNLVEIVIAIVLVGILSAVVVAGIRQLTDQGSAAGCNASADADPTSVERRSAPRTERTQHEDHDVPTTR